MCGIWGLIHRGAADSGMFDSMAAAFSFIEARGPDARGFKHGASFGSTVLLAHSRLSIIDLSALGAQPMVDAGSGWWLVFNGEIYNYREIRAQLLAEGQHFVSASDTEVLLRAWAVWGLDALPRLNGMFAFAAFHPVRGELWLVRDRFGVKPLAWGRCPNGDLTFGSSVAGVAQQVGAAVDSVYCARGVRYKAYETAQSGSPFQNVRSVPAGCWTRFRLAPGGAAADGAVDVSDGQWYCLKTAVAARVAGMERDGDADLLEQCRALFDSAVNLRLRSDVPVAVSLSAGLDSSTIASLMARNLTHLRAFSFGSPAARASEGPATAAFSKATGIDVTYIWPTLNERGLCEALETSLAVQEAPFSGLSPIAQNAVFRSVSEAGFKVLLGGQGSDEIFAGYRKFFIVALREALFRRAPGAILRLLYSLGVMLAHEASQARMYWQNLTRYQGGATARFQLLDWDAGSENLWGAARTSLAERQIEDIVQWSMPTLLRYEDRNSMGYGVETRLPFMDYRLIEFALALPTHLKIANGYGKWALRSMTQGLVPDPIRLNRKKRGFDVTSDWVGAGIGASLRARIFDHRGALCNALKPGLDLDALLSDASLAAQPDLLDEALLLAWMVNPTRTRGRSARTVAPS
jgi:asparagine synthase (glutamine-hydrolysing)